MYLFTIYIIYCLYYNLCLGAGTKTASNSCYLLYCIALYSKGHALSGAVEREPTGATPSCADSPEELKVQAGLGQEELVILLKPHLAHGSVLQNTQQQQQQNEP